MNAFHFGRYGWRLAVVAALVWSALKLGGRLGADLRRDAWTSWWDPATVPDGDLTWEALRRLVEPPTDPIDNEGAIRPGVGAAWACRLVAIAGAVAMTSAFLTDWLAEPYLPAFLTLGGEQRLPADALVNLSGNLTALLALVAAAASIWFANSQLRSKVRADNRQEWLAAARTLLAEVVALARERADADASARTAIDERLDPSRLRFELMLNPREKDHRLLMHLLRRLAFLDDPKRAEAADGGAFLKVLRDHCVAKLPAADGASHYDACWKDIAECDRPPQLTTYVMRLGHVVLKREWERVKAAR